tara:strand:- start:1686 stop:1901 length:216 start_codon:yes stop_codon:yes gene_type:complete
MMNLEELAAEAAQLDEVSRASLASTLLQSLSPPTRYISDEEVHLRVREADEDPTVMLTHEEFISGIETRGN